MNRFKNIFIVLKSEKRIKKRKMKLIKNNTFAAIAILTGTTIGAGFLGLPYVASKSGLVVGIIHIVILGLIILFTNLCLGEVSLRTKRDHQLTGYAEKYLGKKGKAIMFFAMLFGIYSALLAYLVAQGESISYILSNTTQYALHLGIIFWILMFVILYLGLTALKRLEDFGIIFVLIIITLILLISLQDIKPENLTYINPNFLFLPFGVTLFAFLGFSVMPELEQVLKRQKDRMKKAIIVSGVISMLAYIIFTFSVVSTFGVETPEIATMALGKIFILLGILTIFTSFLALSFAIRDMYIFDFKFSKNKSWLFVSLPTILLYIIIKIFGLASFTRILSISGTVSGGLVGVMILIMNMKAKRLGNRKPEYSMKINLPVIIILSLIFVAGIVYEVLRFF